MQYKEVKAKSQSKTAAKYGCPEPKSSIPAIPELAKYVIRIFQPTI
jgi:hypothetical protein